MDNVLQKSPLVPSLESARVQLGFVGILGLAVAAVWSTSIAASTWKSVRGQSVQEKRIQVTGSAKKRIVSDTIAWQAKISATHADRTQAYKALKSSVERAVAFLKAQGIKPDEIRPQSATFAKLTHNEVVTKKIPGGKEEVHSKEVFDGFSTTQEIIVSSHDVHLVERAAREITALLEEGISIESEAPSYYYSKLGELKLEMLAAAGKDARARAENILRSAGGVNLGKLVVADMGIININPANSTNTSEEGNNDVTSLEKDIITIVHATFALE